MDESAVTEAAKPQRKGAGAGFPSMALSDAAEAIRRAGSYGYEHQVEALAQYMGHSTSNSGPFRKKLASLRDFGLVTGRGDSLSLSPLARAIAHPEDADAALAALQEAFFESDVFAKVHAALAKGIDLSVDGIGNAAVRNFNVSAASKDAFIGSFVASALEAGVAERVDDQHVRILPRGSASAAHGDSDDDRRRMDQLPPPRTPQTPPGSFPTALRQEWSIGDGQLIIEVRSARPMPPAAYAQIAKVVEAAEGLAALLVSEQEQGITGGPSQIEDD